MVRRRRDYQTPTRYGPSEPLSTSTQMMWKYQSLHDNTAYIDTNYGLRQTKKNRPTYVRVDSRVIIKFKQQIGNTIKRNLNAYASKSY